MKDIKDKNRKQDFVDRLHYKEERNRGKIAKGKWIKKIMQCEWR